MYTIVFALLILASMAGTALAIAAANGIQSMAGLDRFWMDQFHKSPVMFGLWCTLLTVVWGALLGFLTDQILRLVGLDLTSRETAEY
jgi:hypothetical protein